MSDEAKVWQAQTFLEGPMQMWLSIEERRRPFTTWNEMRTQISRCYQGAHTIDLLQIFLAAKQESTVQAYWELFELSFIHLDDVPEEVLMAVFVNSLDEHIKANLLVQPPDSLRAAYEEAKRLERRNFALSKLGLYGKPKTRTLEPPSILHRP